MKRVITITLVALLTLVAMASCDDRNPIAENLPTPDVEFRAVEELESTAFIINVKNGKDVRYDYIYKIVVGYTIEDASGNVLFTETLSGTENEGSSIAGRIAGVSAGDMLTCTVTFDYQGFTRTATVTDIVG